MNISTTIAATIGWVGAISFITAYALLSAGRLGANSRRYHLLNALGGLCLVINAISHADLPALAVNLVWMLIAVIAMIRIAVRKSVPKPSR